MIATFAMRQKLGTTRKEVKCRQPTPIQKPERLRTTDDDFEAIWQVLGEGQGRHRYTSR